MEFLVKMLTSIGSQGGGAVIGRSSSGRVAAYRVWRSKVFEHFSDISTDWTNLTNAPVFELCSRR
jgi:hypothetical protein